MVLMWPQSVRSPFERAFLDLPIIFAISFTDDLSMGSEEGAGSRLFVRVGRLHLLRLEGWSP